MNIALDLWFVLGLNFGIAGAAAATVISQYVSGIGLLLFTVFREKKLLPERKHFKPNRKILGELFDLSFLTCAQQSAMNFGILLRQNRTELLSPDTGSFR